MAKGAGGVRASKWSGDIYSIDGVRREYADLPEARKEFVRDECKRIGKAMAANLRDKSVVLDADGEKIKVQFNAKGCEHIARDAMLTLSGKYFSESSMVHIDKILSQASYERTSHASTKGGRGGRQLWFKYNDATGRGVHFKIAYNPNAGDRKYYTLYAVGDK